MADVYVPAILTDRISEIDRHIADAKRKIEGLTAERDSLLVAVDAIKKSTGFSTVAAPERMKSAPPSSKRVHSYHNQHSKILGVLKNSGSANRHDIANALGMKPDYVSQRLTEMKGRNMVYHDTLNAKWSAA
jgi:hypothetical protein